MNFQELTSIKNQSLRAYAYQTKVSELVLEHLDRIIRKSGDTAKNLKDTSELCGNLHSALNSIDPDNNDYISQEMLNETNLTEDAHYDFTACESSDVFGLHLSALSTIKEGVTRSSSQVADELGDLCESVRKMIEDVFEFTKEELSVPEFGSWYSEFVQNIANTFFHVRKTIKNTIDPEADINDLRDDLLLKTKSSIKYMLESNCEGDSDPYYRGLTGEYEKKRYERKPQKCDSPNDLDVFCQNIDNESLRYFLGNANSELDLNISANELDTSQLVNFHSVLEKHAKRVGLEFKPKYAKKILRQFAEIPDAGRRSLVFGFDNVNVASRKELLQILHSLKDQDALSEHDIERAKSVFSLYKGQDDMESFADDVTRLTEYLGEDAVKQCIRIELPHFIMGVLASEKHDGGFLDKMLIENDLGEELSGKAGRELGVDQSEHTISEPPSITFRKKLFQQMSDDPMKVARYLIRERDSLEQLPKDEYTNRRFEQMKYLLGLYES